MNRPKLDSSSLEKAIASLSQAWHEYEKHPENEFIRDASIQRFEYTYELSHKMLRRYLAISEPSREEVGAMSFPDLIRTGSERNLLLNGWDQWNIYRAARNQTSHAYDEGKALEVCAMIPAFLNEVEHLLKQLKAAIPSL